MDTVTHKGVGFYFRSRISTNQKRSTLCSAPQL